MPLVPPPAPPPPPTPPSQCAAVGFLYAESSPVLFGALTGGWFTLCIAALIAAPLHSQRPLSLLLFLASMVALVWSSRAQLLPRTPGAEWVRAATSCTLCLSVSASFSLCLSLSMCCILLYNLFSDWLLDRLVCGLWCRAQIPPLLAVKYLLSHVPRHEPYY